ncbi:methionine synthase (5-methyltetrahydrofolate:L-homocysteine S-methyltransferase) [Propionibacterium freudenreichii]|uniref:methionine synthase n=1 Tax=Propionibacterium freudenreichii TaxID=1744 RepID=UPI0005439C4C|nr:methionine synthase [Propionibacterium freudenreichii]CEH06848.1 methionine synthase (5-methyltetrahydrofolate:L-homocysteine S-methyltransferase) [Propionibacterium freudenreichii]
MQNRDPREVLGHEVILGDGAMGTMLQAAVLGPDDFEGHDGCNEILNVTRPDVILDIHRAYLAAGSDVIETNTFGANAAALGEYGITDRLAELAGAGARLARQAADEAGPGHWVFGSIGPGTKLPTLGHIDFVTLRDAYYTQVSAMIDGGVDAVQIETCQDLLQAKAAVIGARRAARDAHVDLPIIVDITVETTGTMLLGSETGAALTSLAPLGVDVIGLNCATGPTEMSEHLRYLSAHADCAVMAMPNAGLPELTADGAVYPLGPDEFARAQLDYVERYGLAIVAGCCGTTPKHIARLRAALGAHRPVEHRDPELVNTVSSLYSEVELRQETSYLAVGERTNANGSKAFREAMLAGDLETCIDLAKAQSREGAHCLDLCVDYVGRDGVDDMAELSQRFSTAVTLPVMLDSTEPEVIRSGLEHLAGRCIINSVNFEDGDQPGSRFARLMPIIAEHGAAVVALTIDEEGQARTAERKVAIAERLVDQLVGTWGMDEGDILVDCLTFPIATGQEETRRDGLETLNAISEFKRRHPRAGTTLGVSNISFGLNAAARVVLNSVFLHEAVEAGLDSAIVRAAKIMPMERIDPEQRQVALDLIYDRRTPDYDPLTRMLDMFAGVSSADVRAEHAAELAALPLNERLRQRIIDGDTNGLTDDLDEALRTRGALDILNSDLLEGMKTVGELFGSGQMQLPFVLQSAETMKRAVAHLEPHMDSTDEAGKGTLVLATVKGDVHDIGKNLVDIIVSNNGYTVVNLGIKQPISAIVEAAKQNHADAIGMSGLLVKSTMVMKDNLAELDRLGVGKDFPVMLGGAALTRTFVEDDLQRDFSGQVRYAKDAFEGLSLMDSVMAIKHGDPDAALPEPRKHRVVARPRATVEPADGGPVRSDVARPVPGSLDVPRAPWFGNRMAKGIGLAEITEWLDERALFTGRWGLRGPRKTDDTRDLIEQEGRPRLRGWLDRIAAEGLAVPGVVYGYFPCYSQGNTLILLDPTTPEALDSEASRFDFPRQAAGRRLCIADFFRDRREAEEFGPDTVALQLVTMGERFSQVTAELFAANAYRDYLELHGLSVQLAEALAELWHHRIRTELGIAGEDGEMTAMLQKQAYRGGRYSFGYGACPDLDQRSLIEDLLQPDRIGVHLSEEFQLHPEQSTDAIVVTHPEAKYFNT